MDYEIIQQMEKNIRDKIEFLEWKQNHKIMPLKEEQEVSNELENLKNR
ncbi:MAG: hypothetical protein HRU03_01490 [Nanoarchaeales archaeon]|nr:hypothetical protein [Nanoarchaeales archaeon]